MGELDGLLQAGWSHFKLQRYPSQAFVANRYMMVTWREQVLAAPCAAAMYRALQVLKPGAVGTPTKKAPGPPPKPRR